jgi:hypothetical protein
MLKQRGSMVPHLHNRHYLHRINLEDLSAGLKTGKRGEKRRKIGDSHDIGF